MIPLFRVFLPPKIELLPELEKVLYSGYIGQGKKVEEFEKAFCSYIGTDRVLSVNSGTSALHLALRLAGVSGGEVITTPMTCLGYFSPVLLSDGTTKAIGPIVNKRLPVTVLSLNESTGKIEARLVTNWIKLDSKEVHWYRVTFNHSKNPSPLNYTNRGIWITGDHQLLTRDGWKEVQAIRPNDEIVTSFVTLNSQQREFLSGTMLGDASIAKPGRGVRGNGNGMSRVGFGHSLKQREWVLLKQKALDGISTRYWERDSYKQSGPSCGIESVKLPVFRRMRDEWYSVRGRKVVPSDLQLTPLTLAVWYMDDGSWSQGQQVVFCTEGFDIESVWRLFWKLTELGFKPRINNQNKKPRIALIKSDQVKFFGMIGPYITPCMRYKIPEDSAPFDEGLWEFGTSILDYSPVSIVSGNGPKTKGSSVYCLEIEGNHNFISNQIVVSNCTATNFPILANGADIVWGDIDPDTGMLDPNDVEKKITKKTKAIMVVHWGGMPANISAFDEIHDKYGIPIIEDAAHALGARWEGSRIGSDTADFTCFSFQAIKHITTVDGGVLITHKPEDYAQGKLLRWYGIDRDSPRKDFRCEEDIIDWGYKFHMNDVNATIGLIALKYADEQVAAHQRNATFYNYEIDNPKVKKPAGYSGGESSYWLYTIRVQERDRFMQYMTDRGIMVSRVHARNDTHTVVKQYAKELPGVDEFESQQVSIPVHSGLEQEDLWHIINAVNEW